MLEKFKLASALMIALSAPGFRRRCAGRNRHRNQDRRRLPLQRSGVIDRPRRQRSSLPTFIHQRRGGINGRTINYIAMDDAYSPPKAVEHIRKLWRAD